MSATIVRFPGRGTALLQRDERLVAGLRELELRFEQISAYVRGGDAASADALAMVGAMEAAELEGVVMGVER